MNIPFRGGDSHSPTRQIICEWNSGLANENEKKKSTRQLGKFYFFLSLILSDAEWKTWKKMTKNTFEVKINAAGQNYVRKRQD
jgi:hypothetical protein